MGRVATLVFGVISYLIFFVTFLYAIGFIGNLVVPKTIDTGTSSSFAKALIINTLLLGLFALQHSLMARQSFKHWWTKIIPKQTERSTYVLISSLLLILLFWQWKPMTGIVWDTSGTIGGTILLVIFALGWSLVLFGSFMIDHFELFGLKQVFFYFNEWEYQAPEFQAPYLYKYVRHPLMLGFILAFWAIPTMTVGHLMFSIVTTVYILVGVTFEERSLVNYHGEKYRRYREQVPMLIPIPGMKYTKESSGFSRQN